MKVWVIEAKGKFDLEWQPIIKYHGVDKDIEGVYLHPDLAEESAQEIERIHNTRTKQHKVSYRVAQYKLRRIE